MPNTKSELTGVGMDETLKETYRRKSWLIFSWWVKVKAESIGKDLIINTVEKYDKIIINGNEITLNLSESTN